MPPLEGIPSEFLDETYPAKTRGMGLPYGENCMILTSTVFDWSTRVTDGQTDRRAIAYMRYSIYAVARKNTNAHYKESGTGITIVFIIAYTVHSIDYNYLK